MASISSIIRRFPFTKESVDACILLVEEFYPQAIDSEDPTQPKNTILYEGQPISKEEFRVRFFSTLEDLDGWKETVIDKNLYHRMLAVQKFFEDKNIKEASSTTLDELKDDQEYWLEKATEKEAQDREIRSRVKAQINSFEEQTRHESPDQVNSTAKQQTEENIELESRQVVPPSTSKPTQPSGDNDVDDGSVFITPLQEVKTVKLSPDEKETLKDLVIAAKTDTEFVKKTSEQMERNLNALVKKDVILAPAENKIIAVSIANSFSENLKLFDENNIPNEIPVINLAPVISTLSQESARSFYGEVNSFTLVQQSVAETVKEYENFNRIAKEVVQPFVGPVLSQAFHPTPDDDNNEECEATKNKKENSIVQIQIQKLKEDANLRYGLIRELKKAHITLSDQEFEKVERQLRALRKGYNYFGVINKRFKSPAPSMGYSALSGSSNYANFLDLVGGRYGLKFGIEMVEGQPILKLGFGALGKNVSYQKAAQSIVGKRFATILGKGINLTPSAINASIKGSVSKTITGGITKAAVKVAGDKVGATIGAFVGGPVGIAIGALLGWIGGELISRIGTWIYKHFGPTIDKIKRGTKDTVKTGALLVGIVIAGQFVSIGSGILIAIGTAVIVIPILVASIFLIINNSAYMVPPGGEQGASIGQPIVSPYIRVVKTANPPGPFENSELPLTIEYTIQVIALQETLSNVELEYECQVIKDGSRPACPNTDPDINSLLTVPQEISASQPYVFSYKQTYDAPTFTDSMIVDTITATATNSAGETVKAAGSASVIIGDPPVECPEGWPILPEGAESQLTITQGPLASYSHSQVEAIDIAATVGHSIFATHNGVATRYDSDVSNYGPIYVDVTSTCDYNGTKITFSSRYAHMQSASVTTGDTISKGQVIGSTNHPAPHLHYEFRGGLPMKPPYIPKDVPYGCGSACGYVP